MCSRCDLDCHAAATSVSLICKFADVLRGRCLRLWHQAQVPYVHCTHPNLKIVPCHQPSSLMKPKPWCIAMLLLQVCNQLDESLASLAHTYKHCYFVRVCINKGSKLIHTLQLPGLPGR